MGTAARRVCVYDLAAEWWGDDLRSEFQVGGRRDRNFTNHRRFGYGRSRSGGNACAAGGQRREGGGVAEVPTADRSASDADRPEDIFVEESRVPGSGDVGWRSGFPF